MVVLYSYGAFARNSSRSIAIIHCYCIFTGLFLVHNQKHFDKVLVVSYDATSQQLLHINVKI